MNAIISVIVMLQCLQTMLIVMQHFAHTIEQFPHTIYIPVLSLVLVKFVYASTLHVKR